MTFKSACFAVLATLLLVQLAAATPRTLSQSSSGGGSCPVTIKLTPNDIPTVCQSKTASEVCGSCLQQVVSKVVSQIPSSTPCDTYPKCLEPFRSQIGQFIGKINVGAALTCNLDDTASFLAGKIQCTGTKPTQQQIKQELVAAQSGALGGR